MTGPSDRRGFLRGLAALPLAGGSLALTTGAANADSPDLARAIEAFLSARDVLDDSFEMDTQAGYRMKEFGSLKMPDELLVREEDLDFHLTYYATSEAGSSDRAYRKAAVDNRRKHSRERREEIARPVTEADNFVSFEEYDQIVEVRRTPWPEAQARADEIVSAWDRWQAEIHRRRRESGADEAGRALSAARARKREADEGLARTPAASMPDLLRKAALLVELYDGDLAEFLEEQLEFAGTTDARLSASIAHDVMLMARTAVA